MSSHEPAASKPMDLITAVMQTEVPLDKAVFNARIQRTVFTTDGVDSSRTSSVLPSGTDALLLVAGDPLPANQPVRQGTAAQRNFYAAKILFQIAGSSGAVPVEILARAGTMEPPNGALRRFVALYASKKRVGWMSFCTGREESRWVRVNDIDAWESSASTETGKAGGY
ncbi:hypothetical protein C8R43DRAFT_1181868 [Mycena crocata]|nr:hypothetical protein C8R43DRAFT_1181868 [Mycena crocata]